MSDPSTPEPGQYGATPEPPQWGDQQQPAYGQPAYGQPQYGSAPGYGTPPPPPPSFQYSTPDDPGAQNALIVGILGLVLGFMCGVGFVASPFALVMGLNSKRRIDASGGKLGGRSNAQTGFILGLAGTVLLVLAVLATIAVILLLAVTWDSPTITINDNGVLA